MVFSASAKDISWTGKWQINWSAGSFVLNIEQYGTDVNGTYEPSNGTVKGTIEDDVLNATTVNSNGIENRLRLTISDSGKSFFGITQFGEWVTGIRVTAKSKFNAVAVDQSSPLKTFYSFLKLGNAVRAGNYEILEKAMDIIYFSEEQDELRHSVKLSLVYKFFNIIDESMVKRLDFFKKEIDQSTSIVLQQQGTDVTMPINFIQNIKSEKWMIKLPEEVLLQEKLKALLSARGKYEIDPNSNFYLSTI